MNNYSGNRYRVKKSNVERFWEYVDIKGEDECWLWEGCTKNEYGTFWIRDSNYANGGKMVSAHRYAYEIKYEPLGKRIAHHLCENKLCVNPKHIVPTDSFGQHTLEHHPNSPTTINKMKTHCIRGHEFTPENTIIDKNGKRKCLACEKSYIKKAQKLSIYKGIYKGKK